MKNVNKFLGIGALSLMMMACTTNPITGRKSLQLANDQEISAMAMQQYREVISKAKVVKGTTAAKSVQNVGLRIKNAANNYYRGIGREADITNYQWEFNLIDDKQVNAWAMQELFPSPKMIQDSCSFGSRNFSRTCRAR